MTTFDQVKEALQAQCTARRPDWDQCKVIRGPLDSDADFFNDTDISSAIIESCPKACDCSVGIYQPTVGDLVATDWEIIPKEDK